MKRMVTILCGYLIAAFLLCLGIAGMQKNIPLLLPGAGARFRLFQGILFFLELLPSLSCGGFLVAFSVAFGRSRSKCYERFSGVMIGHYKNVMICSLILVFILTAGKEVAGPHITRLQLQAQKAPYLLSEYLTLGKTEFSQGRLVLSHAYAKQALTLSPDNPDAQMLIDKTESVLNAMHPVKKMVHSDSADYYDVNAAPDSITSLLKKSEDAAAAGKWFDAHYYAQLAIASGSGQDINLDQAKRDAAIAWNHVSGPLSQTDPASELFFEKKRAAYTLLSQGDVLEAYYQFLALSETSEENAADPDVRQYLEISREKVQKDYFFLEETTDLQQFESRQNVYFHVNNANGSQQIISVRGITPVARSGDMVQYLRGLTVYTYDRTGKFEKSCTVAYAKLVVQSADMLSPAERKNWGIKPGYDQIPTIMLRAVSRDGKGSAIDPLYTYGDDTVERNESPYIVLPLPFTDFELLCAASQGPAHMDLLSLAQFVPVSKIYGYSTEVFGVSLVQRVMNPLLLLVFLIFSAAFAWNYRIGEKVLFKFRWIFVLPLSTFIAYGILKIFSAMINLVDFLFVGLFGQFALVLSLVCGVILLCLVSINFLGRTSD